MREEPELKLKRMKPTGDAEMFVLTDSVGYERRFVVSSAQMAVSDSAIADAINRAVAEYRQTTSPQ